MKKLLLLLLLIPLLFSCSDEDSIVDTDGDGMSDSKELEFFNPEVDPTAYNPKVSDLPILDIDIYNVPQLSVNYIETRTRSSSSSTTRDSGSENTTTTGENYIDTVSATLEANASILDAGVSGSGTVSGTVEITDETSDTIRNSISRSREYANEHSLTAEEAKISVPVFIKNIGNMPISVRDLTLTAYSVNYYGRMEMIGSLTAEDFESIYLLPGNDPVIINFQNDGLYPSRIENIMYYSKRIIVVPASYDMNIISNDEVVGYHEAYSSVKAKTARFHYKDSIHDVNNQDFDNVHDVVVDDLLSILDMFNMKYVTKDDWFYSIDGQRGHNVLTGGEWEVRHVGARDGERFDVVYNSSNPNLDMEIKPADKIYLYRTKVEKEEEEQVSLSLSHGSIDKINGQPVENYVEDVNKVVKLERNDERGVYQEIDLDMEPQRRLEIETPNNILFEFSLQADLGNGVFREADPAAEEEETEYKESHNRSPKRVFINGKEIDISAFYESSEMAYDPGTLTIDLDELDFPEDEKIEVVDFYFTGGADPEVLPYTPQPSEEGAEVGWYNLPHIETYIFGE